MIAAHLRKITFMLLALAPALTGCSGEPAAIDTPMPQWARMQPTDQSQPSARNAASGSLIASPASLDAVRPASKSYRIALIVNDPAKNTALIQTFIQRAHVLRAQSEALNLPQTKPIKSEPGASFSARAGEQTDRVRMAALKGVNALCITPNDLSAEAPALKAAQQKGIAVIVVRDCSDMAIAKTQGFTPDGCVGADPVTGGRLAGRTLALKLGGRGQVVALGGPKTDQLIQGFASVLNGILSVVDAEAAVKDQQDAARKVEGLLARCPRLSGIFCADEVTLRGTMQAISKAGRQQSVSVVGYGEPSSLNAEAKSVGGKLSAVVDDRPDLMGQYAAEMAVGILEGRIRRGDSTLVGMTSFASEE